MKRAVILSTVVLPVTLLLLSPAIAQEPDAPCYLRQTDGTIVDLSTWCKKSTPPTVLSPNVAFVANFQAIANNYPDTVRQQLNRYANDERDSAIASAKTTCRVLRFGGRSAQLKRQQALASYDPSPSGVARRQIINSLAVNQYCPELANR